MQIQERLIIPGLGVVILLSAFILGAPLVYKLLLGLLGLAAAGTYFAPQQVQVETRIAIAALGLIILLIITSIAFWLTLLSFGAIAALQLQHRHMLQGNPATITWLGTLLKDVQARRSGQAEGGGETQEAETATPAGDDENRPQAASPAATIPGFVRLNVAGIGGSVAGVLVLAAVFMPWYGFLISAFGELAGGESLTLRSAGEDVFAFQAFFYILAILGLLSLLSIVLPRAVAALVAVAGVAVTLVSYVYMVGVIEDEAAELTTIGADVLAIPAIGSWIAGIAFLIMFVLQLIPSFNRSRSRETG